MLQEAVVEPGVVRDHDATADARRDLVGDLAKPWRGSNHRVGDTGERLDLRRDAAFGIDEGAPGAWLIPLVDAQDSDLGHPVASGRGACRLEIDEGDGRGEHLNLTDERSFASLHRCRTIVPTSLRCRTITRATERCRRTLRSAGCSGCARRHRLPPWSQG